MKTATDLAQKILNEAVPMPEAVRDLKITVTGTHNGTEYELEPCPHCGGAADLITREQAPEAWVVCAKLCSGTYSTTTRSRSPI